ncbi:MAG: PAS domain S-box protein [Pseudomonadota bacterium]|nr:PAS domain S-box protein [Pseudomonadota bacterium]
MFPGLAPYSGMLIAILCALIVLGLVAALRLESVRAWIARGPSKQTAAGSQTERSPHGVLASGAGSLPHVPACLLSVDASGRVVDANPAWTEAFGYPLITLRGHKLQDIVDPGSHEVWHWLLGVVRERSFASSIEFRMVHHSQQLLDVAVTAEPLAPAAAPESRVLLSCFDLTHLRRTERALAQREERFRTLVEDQTDLVSLASTDGILTFVNHAYARHFGMSIGAMVGRSLFDFISSEDEPVVRRHLRAVIETGKPAGGQNRLIAANGKQIWVNWHNRMLPDAEGRLRILHSVGRDITERMQTEHAMQILSHEQAAIINTEMIGFAKIRDRQFLWVSTGLAGLLGYTVEQLTGASTRLLFFDQYSYEQLGSQSYPLIRSGKTFRGELDARHASGNHVWLEASAVIFDASRDESLWVYSSITARKQAELALRENLALAEQQRAELEALRSGRERA